MLSRLGIWFALAACVLTSGCVAQPPVIVGSGVMVGESYDLQDFRRLSIHDSMDVTVLQGEGFAVEVSADDNVIEFVKVEQQGDELRIGLSKSLRLQRGRVVCVVHLPKLTGRPCTAPPSCTSSRWPSNTWPWIYPVPVVWTGN